MIWSVAASRSARHSTAAATYTRNGRAVLFGRIRVGGADPERGSYRSFASFKDPDGNGWLLQEITARLPGRVEGGTTFPHRSNSRQLFAVQRPRTASTRSDRWPA